MLARGTVLCGRYQIEKLIEEGGMSFVYAARDNSLGGARVAVKQMKGAFTDEDEKRRVTEQFRLEATMLANLVHHGLPRVTNSFDAGETSYLVMDLIDGDSLTKMLNRLGKTPPESLVWMWMYEVCEVLEYLHTRKPPIIFRDLKPSNIMVTWEGHVRVIDFGISKIFDVTMDGATRTAIRGAGTPGYQPPEQYGKNSARRTDPRSDLYSLGATIYSVLTFQVPPEATDRFMNQVPLTPVRELSDVTAGLDAMIERLMRLDPEARYGSARDVMKELMQWMGGPPPRDPVDLPAGMLRTPEGEAPVLSNAPPTRMIPDGSVVVPGVPTAPPVPPPAPVVVYVDPALHHQPTQKAPPSVPDAPILVGQKSSMPWLVGGGVVLALLGGGMWYGTHQPGPTPSPSPSPTTVVSATPSATPSVAVSPSPSASPTQASGFRVVVAPAGTEVTVTVNGAPVPCEASGDGFLVPVKVFEPPVRISLSKTGYVPIDNIRIGSKPDGPKHYRMIQVGSIKFNTRLSGQATLAASKQHLAEFGLDVPVAAQSGALAAGFGKLPPGHYHGSIDVPGYYKQDYTANVQEGKPFSVAVSPQPIPVATPVPVRTYRPTARPHPTPRILDTP